MNRGAWQVPLSMGSQRVRHNQTNNTSTNILLKDTKMDPGQPKKTSNACCTYICQALGSLFSLNSHNNVI